MKTKPLLLFHLSCAQTRRHLTRTPILRFACRSAATPPRSLQLFELRRSAATLYGLQSFRFVCRSAATPPCSPHLFELRRSAAILHELQSLRFSCRSAATPPGSPHLFELRSKKTKQYTEGDERTNLKQEEEEEIRVSISETLDLSAVLYYLHPPVPAKSETRRSLEEEEYEVRGRNETHRRIHRRAQPL
ncbi:unnamed protein product [Vicia faba]|uniref:Uncharacterized protein n=1 Tax=Vicia faba TaxID=3906 RepID=A0AAV1A445_VICFA|nr:unnamed protein product [Vicia faba]